MDKKLQVFISSTFTDLIKERQAAVQAILRAGHIPAGMELFTAGDISQMETIKKWIDESDIFMLILGGRYGSIEPTTGLSYVELEYDYASKSDKPFFAIVIKEEALKQKGKYPGASTSEQENPEKLARFRKKVLSKMSAFYSEEKDITIAIFVSLKDLNDKYSLNGWVRGNYAKTEEELARINEMHEHINDLEKEVEKHRKVARKGMSEFSQNYEELPKSWFKESVPEKLNWNDVFLVIAKDCLSGGRKIQESNIRASLIAFFVSRLKTDVEKGLAITFGDVLNQIKIQFSALKLIEFKTITLGPRNAMSTTWHLTEDGIEKYTNLSAIKSKVGSSHHKKLSNTVLS